MSTSISPLWHKWGCQVFMGEGWGLWFLSCSPSKRNHLHQKSLDQVCLTWHASQVRLNQTWVTFLCLLRKHYQKENPHHFQGDHVKANKCNHMIRVSRCVTSLCNGVVVCLPAFPFCCTSEIVKFFWGRVGGYDFEVAHLLRGTWGLWFSSCSPSTRNHLHPKKFDKSRSCLT